jgi:hypothetical protein
MTTVTVDDIVYTVTVASAASDTQVITSGSGTSLINTSTGGITNLNSISAGANVTITDDNSGTLTIAATEDNLSNNTTSDLAEGTNQYFTDARVMTALETVSGDIIPDGNQTRSLGSTTKQWHSVHVGPGSLYIDGHKVLGSDDTDTINFSTDTGQTMDFFAGGATGTAGVINMASRGNVTSFNDTLIHLGPDVGGNTVRARGTLEAPDLHVGNLEFAANKIDSTSSNGNLEIATDGTGYLHLNSADVYVGPIAGAVKIDESSITTTAGDLTISATGNVNVAGHYTSAETDSAISTATSALVDSAPAALDTLNELASALGDDANFATTTATSIGTKWTQDNTKISQWDTAYGWGNHATPGYITGYTVTESDVTGHQAALTITQSQISDLQHQTTATIIAAVEGESTLDLTGDVTLGATKTLQVGGLNMSTSTFTQAANTGMNFTTSGAGGHYNFTTDDALYLGNSSAYMTIKPTLIASTGATLAITGNLTGNVTGDLTGNVDAPTTVSVGSLDITTNNITQSTADQPVNITTSGSNAFINATAPALYLGTGATNFLTLTPSKISTETSGSTRLEIEAGHLAANPANRTFPPLTNWGPYDIQASTGNGLFTQADFGVGYPIFAVARTDAIGESQATASYFVNSMQYDHHDQASNMAGHGTEVRFAAQDQAGNLHELGANLVKMKNVTTGGSAGSSTVTGYDGEYTLTLGKYNDGGLNAITVNKDFGQHTKEIRITDTPRNSGSTSLSGLYLTYEGSGETSTPSAKIQLRNEGAGTTTNLMTLEEDRVSHQVIQKMHTLTSDPSSPEAGDFYFNSSTSKFRGYNGTAWVNFHG